MKKLSLILLTSLALVATQAQKPWKKGVIVDEFICDNPPFPESHASTVVETPQGLVAAWFGGTKERNPDVCIWVSQKKNSQWTKPKNVANGVINDTLRYACWNPVLYQVPGGELWLFYKVGPNVAGWKGWMLRSKDNGDTWSSPEALPDGFLGPIKNKPVMVDGKIVCPSSTEAGGWKAHFEITDVKANAWQMIGPINDGKTLSFIQPSILNYKDGSLQALGRSKDRAIVESWSHDRGQTWSAVTTTDMPNNNSGTDAVTLKDGRQLLVYNHVRPADSLKNGKGARTPLNVAVSKDGKTWYAAAILEDSPVSQYSYPSVIQSKDGMVHIVYTWRRKKIKYVMLDPSKLEMKKISKGEWPAMKGYEAPKPGSEIDSP